MAQKLYLYMNNTNFYSSDLYAMNDYFDFSKGTRFLNSFINKNIGTFKYGEHLSINQFKGETIHGATIKFNLKK
jgi:hypothetical protein